MKHSHSNGFRRQYRRWNVLFTLPLCLLLVWQQQQQQGCHAYMMGLPREQKVAWLNDMMTKITSIQRGKMTEEMLEQTHICINAWSHLQAMDDDENNINIAIPLRMEQEPTTRHDYVDPSRQIEQLTKRLIDEEAAGNRLARRTTQEYHATLRDWARQNNGLLEPPQCRVILDQFQIQQDQLERTTATMEQHAQDFQRQQRRAEQEQQQKVLTTNDDDDDDELLSSTCLLPKLTSYSTLHEAWEQVFDHNQGNDHRRPPLDSKAIIKLCYQAQTALDEMILEEEEALQDGTSCVCPDPKCFDMVLQLWSKAATVLHMERNHHRSRHRSAAKKSTTKNKDLPSCTRIPLIMEELVMKMERLYRATGNSSLKPKTSTFNAILSAWSKCDLEPCPKKASSHCLPVQHVMDILHFMEAHADASEEDDCQHLHGGRSSTAPDMISYSTVMETLTKHSRRCPLDRHNDAIALQANEVLGTVERLYHQQDYKAFVPRTRLYNGAISCWAMSKTPGAYAHVQDILARQEALVSKQSSLSHPLSATTSISRPTVRGINSALAACASESLNKSAAFETAVEIFERLCRNPKLYGEPTHFTYGTMLKCCAQLLPQKSGQRREWSHKIWHESVEDGCVSDMVMHQLRIAHPPLYHDIAKRQRARRRHRQHSRQEPAPRGFALPARWTRNVIQTTNHNHNKHRTLRQQQEHHRQGRSNHPHNKGKNSNKSKQRHPSRSHQRHRQA